MKSLRASDIQVRRGEVRFIRFGKPKPVKQVGNEWAPARRGMWAFPWPAREPFFYWHKWNEVLPRHLAMGQFGTEQSGMPLVSDEEYAKKTGRDPFLRWNEREDWIRNTGWKVMGISDFWHGGAVWSHIDPNGNVLYGFQRPEYAWYRHEFANGTYLKGLRRYIAGEQARWMTHRQTFYFDDLEVFIEC